MTTPEREIIHVYGLTAEQKSKLRVAAAQADMTLSKYCYQLLKERTEDFTDIKLKGNAKK